MASDEVDISVIIVTADNWADLHPCIESVYRSFRHGRLQVICVDDCSQDDSAAKVTQHFPQVHLVNNTAKQSYPVTNNQGIAAADGRYVMLLNDDVVLAEGALDRVVDFLDRHEQAGAASPRLLNPDGTVQPCVRGFPSLAAALAQSLYLHRLWPGNPYTGRYYATGIDYSQTQAVPSIGTTAYVMRRECLEQIGGLDEAFPINFCDLDLNWRLGQADWQIWLVAYAEATHKGGQTMGRLSLAQLRDYHRGMLLMYRKHYAPRRLFVINGLVYLGIAVRFLLNAILRIVGLDRLLAHRVVHR